LSTAKDSYYEGEKITFFVTITNTDQDKSHPVLVPHTQNVGPKLFYLSAYDKAANTHLLRYTEDKMLRMMVHDTGSVQLRVLKPREQLVIPIYLNDFENYYSYHTQNAAHHSFGVPLFAGIYRIQLTYAPYGLALGDSIYSYYQATDTDDPDTDKLPMPVNGQQSQLLTVKIKRSAATQISIERQKYFIKTDGDRFYYLTEDLPDIVTDTRCHHITNLPADSFSVKNEYFYSHYTDLYAEYVARFEDGDIREYRKFSDWCPSYLYTERYNEQKQKTHFELQLPDKRFYSISYYQPSGQVYQESYCSANGTVCEVATYRYDKKGILIRKQITQTSPCVEFEINGVIRSAHRAGNLEKH
jgi:hypothetical protein